MTPRVVSLVPSVTETLLALGVTPIACTRFCEQPGLTTVGGTKDPDVAAIVAMAPDLVVVNDEENRREDADALEGAGLSVHVMSPRLVADVPAAVDALARAVGAVAPGLELAPAAPRRGSAVIFVWRRPWMVAASDTYGASVLDHLGWVPATLPGATSRYVSLTDADVAALDADLLVLPSEPYPFAARHRDELADLVGIPAMLLDGQDLFWWGTRTPHALARLASALGARI